MSNKLIIPFDGSKASDIESGGVTTFIGYERLKGILASSANVGISSSEKIIGFVIEGDGILIRIGKK